MAAWKMNGSPSWKTKDAPRLTIVVSVVHSEKNRKIRSAGLHEGETAVLRKGRTGDHSLETLRRVLGECLRKGKERGDYVTFEPPCLMEELESCYNNDLRRKYRCFCRGFAMATIAPAGDVLHCYVIRKTFGNIRKGSLADTSNSPEAARFRLGLLEQNLDTDL